MPGPCPKQLILFKRMKEGRVLEVEGTASAKLLKYENECCLLVDT